jgi:type VI secretion system protein ImpG
MSRRISDYFEDEMHYLHEAGKIFAELHPDRAGYLNVDSLTDRDPYVERLFEGFAFLTGRIRERLDDELPQYTESLLRLLHPHFVKPVPSLSILEFRPRPGMLQQTTRLAAGTEVRSPAVGEERTVCRFTTTYPVDLQPITLRTAQLEWPDSHTSRVTLRFQVDRGIELQKLDLKKLRLYLYAEPATASLMHLFLTRHVERVEMRAGDASIRRTGQKWVRPVGFARDEGLIPYSEHSFPGYRLLQEYFCFRPKFWFVDLLGLDELAAPAGTSEFEVAIALDRTFPEARTFKTENVRLYCSPIVNLFETDAEPIRVEHRASEYRVVGDAKRPRSVAAYDIQRVTGIEEATGRRHAYSPFFAFSHAEDQDRFFTETARRGLSGMRETYIAIGGLGEAVTRLPTETLTLEARCTNADVPREALQEGRIDQPAPAYPNVASFKNITQPSRELHPPTEQHVQFFWKLISHLSLNQLSIATPEALTTLLRLYEWTGSEANLRRIEGIRDVGWNAKEIVFRGGIIRGAEVTIVVQDEHFSDEGDLHLFGMVMSTFLSMYATINSFIHLTLTSKPTGESFHWAPERGNLPLV